MSNVGLFNSCWCASGAIFLGRKRAYVPLNTTVDFVHNNKKLYPVIITMCFGLQIAVSLFMMWTGRHGLRLMRWSESEKRGNGLGGSDKLFSLSIRRSWRRILPSFLMRPIIAEGAAISTIQALIKILKYLQPTRVPHGYIQVSWICVCDSPCTCSI